MYMWTDGEKQNLNKSLFQEQPVIFLSTHWRRQIQERFWWLIDTLFITGSVQRESEGETRREGRHGRILDKQSRFNRKLESICLSLSKIQWGLGNWGFWVRPDPFKQLFVCFSLCLYMYVDLGTLDGGLFVEFYLITSQTYFFNFF